jgi:light-independent protochlorophyllide reductase B subunit
MYPEHAETAARWMERTLGIPYTKTVPIGVGATHDFVAEVAQICGVEPKKDLSRLRQPWWSVEVDSTYLTGKRVFLFGDATHVTTAARIARDEMGFEVVGLGCYNREFARSIRALGKEFGVEPLITDDYLEVEKAIEDAAPEMILGTQMERHIGKRLGIPCAVISAPVHVQDFPARYSPQMGWEGRERHLRHLDPSAGHGAGGAPAGHVPRGFRVPRRGRAQPSRRPCAQARRREPETAPAAEVAPEERISGKMKEPDGAEAGRPAPTSWSGWPMPSAS